MAKNAEDRYQSALGLKHDLQQCFTQWKETGEIAEFELGQRDICDRFLIPEKLYGREAEVQTLLDAFDRVADGNSEMMLVAGLSGIGKTAVVNEVHKPITQKKGYFIKGKFDQFNRNIPFCAFVQAFRSLMGQLLGESDAALVAWKTKILAAVGESGQVLVEVIPELAAIVGEQPPVPELSGSAAQNRFNLLFGQFVRVFATPEHPLVIFLDDLQWGDSASLNLLKLLMEESERGHLLVLGAYRDNEVFPAHPLMLCLDEIEKQGGQLETLTLKPLSESDINQLVADTLLCETEVAAPLSRLTYQKTRGNPFFTTQFLQGLHEEGCIIFEVEAGYWQCDMARLRELTLTDDVVAFMVGRLQKLPKETQEVLKLAACIGNHFDLQTLAKVCNLTSQAEVAVDLWCVLQEGFVVPENETYKFFQGSTSGVANVEEISIGYRFLHDRVQQAAYSLISDDRKQATHLKIGQLILNKTSESELEENIFTIVNQLNIALSLIKSESERLQLARLNLVAGKKAKASTAYTAAIEYLEKSLALLPEHCWKSQYDLTLSCYVNAIECEYLNAHFVKADSLAKIVLKRAQNLLDRVRIYELKIQMHVARLESMAAMELGLQVLEMLGVELVETPPDCLEVEALIDLQELTDTYHLAVMRILMSLISSAYFADPTLLPKIIFTTIARSRLYGNSFHSAYGYVLYGLLLCGPFQDIDMGYRYGQLALKLLDKFDAKEIKARVLLVFNGNIRHWKEHTQKTLNPLKEAIQVGLEVGDIEYVGYASGNCSEQIFAIGEPLDSIEKKRRNYLNLMRDLGQEYSINHHQMGLQVTQNLLGKTDSPDALIGSAFDETKMLPIFLKSRNATLLFNLYLAKGRLCYLFGNPIEAFKNLNLAAEYMDSVAGMITVGEQNFYSSLAAIAAASECQDNLNLAIERATANQEKMQYWVTHAPENYQHKYDLVEAEKHRILKQKIEAIESYDRAIAGAKENKYIQEEALANELAAKFYLDWGKEKFAEIYMQEAYYCYARWGAKAKIDRLKKDYPQLLEPIFNQPQNGISFNTAIATLQTEKTTSASTNVNQLLDLASLMKASHILSQDIELDSAIANLMHILQENAGAQTVALMLLHEENLILEAKSIDGEMQPVRGIPILSNDEVPLSIVNTVQHTQNLLVLDNASDEPTYAGDTYIRKYKPKSILCLPLRNRGQKIGILYLENDRCSGAFAEDRVEVLTLLCTQAAIALENARLYQQAQQALQLEKDIHELQRTQLQLIQSEKMYSLGQMVGGIAHEINNPINFIHANVSHANHYMEDALGLIDLYQQYYPDPHPAIGDELEALDFHFLKTDFQNLLQSMKSGSDRIKNIVTSLRTFSRLDEAEFKAVDLHNGLESTLTILENRLQAREQHRGIQVIKDYGKLPLVECYAGQLNQVFMNILNNAIDALSKGENQDSPTIRICTRTETQNIILTISDNGIGMSDDTRHRIFDPFFTTKPVGQGTGLGMAIAYQVIVEKHGGSLTVESEEGRGTQFSIRLPI